ncbi:phage tail tape measure protein [uncultured Pantoea sp.]|uniref:phage tail tape measure protein n=1 Tax=uncultured Pantoea sp. TaxID=218084 RepID=UPI002049068A|nr:phage tail tape measure protein [uncultured Pantoea sp.]DAL08693.1 MAG TPA_asm: minor tail protein [Caudoviricetes sp.]
MSDKNLRLQVVLGAVDKLTRPFRSARDSTRELAGTLRDTRNTLKELDAQAGRIDGFRKTRSQLAITANNLKAAREEAARLAVQFTETNKPTAAQARVLEQAKNRASQLQQTYNGLRLSVQRQREALGAAGIDTKKLSQAQRELKSQSDEACAAIDRQQQSLKKLGERQAKLSAVRERYSRSLEVRDRVAGAGAATSAAGLAMGAPVLAAVKSSAAMEDAMKGVAKQVNGLRDDKGNRTKQFYDMQAAIKAASEQLPMENGAIDYAALVEGGARMGVTNQNDSYEDQKRDLLAFATTAAKASTAFELPAGELAEGLGKIAQLYKIPTRNIEQLGDALNYLDDNAMSKGSDIIDVLQRMGGVADRLDYRKAAALGSTFLSLGATSETAASAANAMVRELSVATMQGKSFMGGMALLKLDPAKIEKQMTTDAMGTIQRVLEKVNNLPKDKRLTAMTMVFGKEFGKDAAKLANNMPELRRQLQLTQGDGAKGSMQKESDINKDSLSAKWMLTKTGVSNTMSGLGDSLRTPLMDIMNMVKKVIGVTRRWVENNKELAGTLVKAAAVISVIVLALGTFMIGLAAVLGPMALLRLSFNVLGIKAFSAFGLIKSGIGILGKSVLGLGRLMMANPILAVIGLIAAGALLIWQNWDTLGPKFAAMWDAISTKVSSIWTAIRTYISTKWGDIVADAKALPARFQEAGSQMIDGLMAGISQKWDAIKNKLSSLTDYLPDFLKPGGDKSGGPQLPRPATVKTGGGVSLPPGGFPGFAGMYDTGGFIPSGQFGVAGENGPELVSGPANVTSRRSTARLAALAALTLGGAGATAEAKPLHPLSLPVQAYRQEAPRMNGSATQGIAPQIHASFTIVQQPGQSQQDLVDEVMRRIEAKERQAQARARSSYRDRGGFEE